MIDETFLTTEEVLEYLQVNLRTDGTFVYANADPAGRCRGEDPDASAAFPVESEIEAERLALLNL